MSESPGDHGYSDFDNDYQVIRLSVTWGSLSVVAFVAIVVLNLGARWFGLGLFKIIGATMALSASGFVLGLIGLKLGNSRGAARVGAFLNGVVLLCIFVILPVVFMILRRLG